MKIIFKFSIVLLMHVFIISNINALSPEGGYINEEIEELYQQIITLKMEGKYIEALKKAKTLLDRYADSSLTSGFDILLPGLYNHAQMSAMFDDYKGNDDSRIQELRPSVSKALIEKDEKNPFELLICALISPKEERGTYDKDFLRQIIERFPDSKYAIYAEFNLISEKTSIESIKKIEEFISKHSNSRLVPKAYCYIASYYKYDGNTKKSIEIYRFVRDNFPTDYAIRASAIEHLHYFGDEITEDELEKANKMTKIFSSTGNKKELIDLNKLRSLKENIMKIQPKREK